MNEGCFFVISIIIKNIVCGCSFYLGDIKLVALGTYTDPIAMIFSALGRLWYCILRILSYFISHLHRVYNYTIHIVQQPACGVNK